MTMSAPVRLGSLTALLYVCAPSAHADDPTGACHLPWPSYECIVVTEAECTNQGGTYQGDDVACTDTDPYRYTWPDLQKDENGEEPEYVIVWPRLFAHCMNSKGEYGGWWEDPNGPDQGAIELKRDDLPGATNVEVLDYEFTTQIYALDEQSRAIGKEFTTPFRWVNGVRTDLNPGNLPDGWTPPTFANLSPNKILPSSQVGGGGLVGHAAFPDPANWTGRPWFWNYETNSFTPMKHTLDGSNRPDDYINTAIPTAINASRVIVGVYYQRNNFGSFQWPDPCGADQNDPDYLTQPRAVRWSSPNATPQLLPMPAGYEASWALDIGDDGTIVGCVRDYQSNRTRPVKWVNGQVTVMPVSFSPEPECAWANHVTVDGDIFGDSSTPTYHFRFRGDELCHTADLVSDVVYSIAQDRVVDSDANGNLVLDYGAAVLIRNVDSDGDGLIDDYERHGIPYLATGSRWNRYVLDLDGDGESDADPMHKDLFLEIDVMENDNLGNPPVFFRDAFETTIPDFFAAAPLNNPDGTTGIRLHTMVDTDPVPYDNLVIAPESTDLARTWAGTAVDRTDIGEDWVWERIRPIRARVIRHLLLAHEVCNRHDEAQCPIDEDTGLPGTNAAGYARAPGDHLIVGLTLSDTVPFDEDQFVETIIHEYGHSLGLQHGGAYETNPADEDDDEYDINFKPNYVSVMNYMFGQFEWDPDGDGRFEPLPIQFSMDDVSPPLDENSVREDLGYVSALYPGVRVLPRSRGLACSTACADHGSFSDLQLDGSPFDFDGDGFVQPVIPVSADLNMDLAPPEDQGEQISCPDTNVIDINEIDAAQEGTDDREFIELTDGGQGGVLNDHVLLLYDGTTATLDRVIALDNLQFNNDGLYVIGGPNTPNANMTINENDWLRDGDIQHAAVIVTGEETDYLLGSPASEIEDFVAAVVYAESDANQLDPTDPDIDNFDLGCSSTWVNISQSSGRGPNHIGRPEGMPPTPGALNEFYAVISPGELMHTFNDWELFQYLTPSPGNIQNSPIPEDWTREEFLILHGIDPYTPRCPADLTGDDVVGPPDLAQILDNWGPNEGHPADLNGDGVVGPPDLAQILDNWGECE